MTKEQTIKVVGYTDSNIITRTYEAGRVVKFENFSGTVFMYEMPTGDYRVITRKGSYILKPDPSQNNLFIGTVGDGINCHFMKEEITGQLSYWS